MLGPLLLGAFACAEPSAAMSDETGDAGAVVEGASVVVHATRWTNTVAMIPVAGGRHYLVVGVELSNPIAGSMPLPASFAFFSVGTEDGLSIAASVVSATTSAPCSVDVGVNPGGSFSCEVVFEIPESDAPATLRYDPLDGRWAEADLEAESCTWCGDSCIDPSTDPSHCGGCDASVPDGFDCVGGEAHCADPMLTDCGGFCVDLETDGHHCGTCDRAVAGGQACVDGSPVDCVDSPDLVNCDGVCRDLHGDIFHCGACDRACPFAEYASARGVTVTCDEGTACRSTTSDGYAQACEDLCGSAGSSCVTARYLYDSGCSLEIGCGEPPATHPECGGSFDHRECSCKVTW